MSRDIRDFALRARRAICSAVLLACATSLMLPVASLLLPTAGLLLPAARAHAHEIPARVTVLAFVKPDGQRLRVAVRVPLEAIRDMEFPLYGVGYLDIEAVEPMLIDAARIWIADYLAFTADGRIVDLSDVVTARITLPSDHSFSSWASALSHVTGARLPALTQIPWQQALFDVLLEYSIPSADAEIAVQSGLAHLGITTTTVMRFVTPAGAERAFHFTGDPGLVRLDPRWHHAALRFVKLGFLHILGGFDHLLFILCLVIPFRRMRPLIVVVTSFTVAHSITLAAAALGFVPAVLWFPPLIETLIAASIVYMALENIVGPRLERRWLITFGFGLVHGFGFSFLLRDSLQFAGSHLTMSLLAFNIGVELGQILVLLVAVPALALLFRHVVAERIGVVLLSAIVAHSAWHWMTERGADLNRFSFAWPALDALLLVRVLQWLMLMAVAAFGAVLIAALRRRLVEQHGQQPEASGLPAETMVLPSTGVPPR